VSRAARVVSGRGRPALTSTEERENQSIYGGLSEVRLKQNDTWERTADSPSS